MAVVASSHTLSTTASVIAAGATSPRRGVKQVIVTNASATIYIGGSNVASSGANGVSVATTATYTINLGPGESLYAVATTGTPTVRTLITNV